MEKLMKDKASLGVMISFIMLIVIPAIITGLQVGYTASTAPLAQYPGTIIAFSVLFYIVVVMLAASSHLLGVSPIYVLFLLMLYLLWSTLLYTLNLNVWAYIVLVILLILVLIIFKQAVNAMTGDGRHILFLVYILLFAYLLGLFIWQSITFFV